MTLHLQESSTYQLKYTLLERERSVFPCTISARKLSLAMKSVLKLFSSVLGRNFSRVCKQAGLSVSPRKRLRCDRAGTMFSEVRVKAGDIAWENSQSVSQTFTSSSSVPEFYLFFKH